MDPDLKREVLDVRKVIEKSTSKVSLKDLEKKGFRQVKVLRAGDINQLIFKAVQNVLAKQPRGVMSEEERERIMAEARADFDRMMADKKDLLAKQNEIQQGYQNLQNRLAEVNNQLNAEKQAILRERQQFERDKQALMESSLQGQQVAAANYEGQLQDLRSRLQQAEQRAQQAEARANESRDSVSRAEHDELRERLAKAEARAEAAESRAGDAEGKARDSIPRDEHEQLRRRLNTQVEDLQEDVERYRKQLRQLEEENEGQLKKLKREKVELEEIEVRSESKVKALQDDKERLEAEVDRLREELAEAAMRAPAANPAHDAELQRLRMEMEQRSARMQDMMAGIANSLVEARKAEPVGGGGGGGDFTKQFEALQRNITQAVRKATGAGAEDFDLTADQAAAIFAAQDNVRLETNISDVEVKQQKAQGVNNKLAKLRNLRGGS